MKINYSVETNRQGTTAPDPALSGMQQFMVHAAIAAAVLIALSGFFVERSRLHRMAHHLLSSFSISTVLFCDIAVWLSISSIGLLLVAAVNRSRLDALIKWAFTAFVALALVENFLDLARSQPAPHWLGMEIRGVLLAVSAVTAVVAIYRMIAQKMLRAPTGDYFATTVEYDALTGLSTFEVLQGRVRKHLNRPPWLRTDFSLLMVDLDQFEQINHSLGHAGGDELICQVAARLQRALRRSDTVARTGPAEFLILLPHIRHAGRAQELAVRLQAAVAGVMQIERHELVVTASIGICLYPQSGDDLNSLRRNARMALYNARARSGNGSSEIFTEEMSREAEKTLQMESALRRALQRNEFELHYQPQISFRTSGIIGLEALIRWNSPKLGRIAPNDFLPLAEKMQLMSSISDWVIERACKDAARLRAERSERLVMAVNLSPSQLTRTDLPDVIARILAQTGVPGEMLEIELTENALVDDAPKTLKTIERIRELGVRLALDDFGTGFSSMSYMLRFQIDRLKIDQSFIRNSSGDAQNVVVTRAIILLAHGLNIQVIAEGVETEAHIAMLMDEGCDEAQGYYFARPQPFEHLAGTLNGLGQQLYSLMGYRKS